MAKRKSSSPPIPSVATKREIICVALPLGRVMEIIDLLLSSYLKTYQKHPSVSELTMTTTTSNEYIYDVICTYQDTIEGRAELKQFFSLKESLSV